MRDISGGFFFTNKNKGNVRNRNDMLTKKNEQRVTHLFFMDYLKLKEIDSLIKKMWQCNEDSKMDLVS